MEHLNYAFNRDKIHLQFAVALAQEMGGRNDWRVVVSSQKIQLEKESKVDGHKEWVVWMVSRREIVWLVSIIRQEGNTYILMRRSRQKLSSRGRR